MYKRQPDRFDLNDRLDRNLAELLSATFTTDFDFLTLAAMGLSVPASAEGAAASTIKALAAAKVFEIICRVMRTSFG